MIDLDIAENGLWTVTLNRPDKANALTAAMLEQLCDIAERAQEARGLIITGVGRVFSAGADLDAARAGLATSPLWEHLSGAIADLPCLTVAALNGTLAGGANGMTVLTLGGSWGAFSGTLIVGDESVAAVNESDTFYGISAAYDVSSATTLTFAYGDGSGDGDTRNIGLGVIHDLGGGVSLRGGIGESKTGNADGQMRADFGAQFSF